MKTYEISVWDKTENWWDVQYFTAASLDDALAAARKANPKCRVRY